MLFFQAYILVLVVMEFAEIEQTTMTSIVSNIAYGSRSSFLHCCCFDLKQRNTSRSCSFIRLEKSISSRPLLLTSSRGRQNSFNCRSPNLIYQGGTSIKKKRGNLVVSPNISSPSTDPGLLHAHDDEYGGVIIDPECLPLSTFAFASMLSASIFNWKLNGKNGVWLKILTKQSDLIPVAIREGFNFHHAEPGYVMLTYWIPNEPCMLPDGPSHQIGIGGFVMNENREVLVVKEKQCPCQCRGIWKLPTGFINKSEEIFSGVVREVKEETGIDTTFLDVIAFRHVHQIAFEKSDLFFACMLKPVSFDISIDEKEIQAAKWMPLEEFIGQKFYQEDQMLRKVINLCVATQDNKHYCGFTPHQLISKFDGKLSYLYYNEMN